MSNVVHVYVSQSDKGELVIGAGADAHISYTQKGAHDVIEENLRAVLELYPIFSRLRMLRQWGGIVDICPDASPIISKTSIKGLYFIVDGERVDLKLLQVRDTFLPIQ